MKLGQEFRIGWLVRRQVRGIILEMSMPLEVADDAEGDLLDEGFDL